MAMGHGCDGRRTGAPAEDRFPADFEGDMRLQRAAIAARRRRQWATFGRLAAWLSFGGAVLSQAALLAGGYFLSDDAPNALRNAGIAGSLVIVGLIVMVLARRAGKRAQSSATNLGRTPLRLVPEGEGSEAGRRARPAA
jgi:hypothetical protein